MTWLRAEKGINNIRFKAVLEECEDYIEHIDELMPKLQREDHVMWYWSSRNFRLALCYKITRDGTHARIVVGVPSPEGNPSDWCKTMIQKLRVELDTLGITEWSATQAPEYKSEHMADFADFIDRICHEVDGDIMKPDRRLLIFNRKEKNKQYDNKFEGRGKDRPPRIRRGV